MIIAFPPGEAHSQALNPCEVCGKVAEKVYLRIDEKGRSLYGHRECIEPLSRIEFRAVIDERRRKQ